MIPRTIVTIEERDGALTARLVKADAMVKEGKKPVALGFSPASLPTLDSPENVKAYGEALRVALMNHPAIGKVLGEIFSTTAAKPRILCFQIDSTEGEQIRWEALCDDAGNFLALDDRFRIGRIAEDVSTSEGNLRTFAPPLRVTAFISAAGVDATVEWQGLSAALDAARSKGIPLEARVYVGQQSLLDETAKVKVAGKLAGVSVFPMPASATEVEQCLNEWPPHIVHFFCHGSAGFGTASIELATVVEHDTKKPASVVINVDGLAAIEGLRNAWVVVLNCCEGGQAVGALHSMAYNVVAKGGIPAAIGMQEAVAVGDANTFCARLYPELFRALDGGLRVAAGAGVVPVDLTSVLALPRRAIRDEHQKQPANFRRWTLPVLYVHDQPLQVYRVSLTPAESEDLQARVGQVAGFLAALPPDAPDDVRDRMLAVLDKHPGIAPELRPDRLGNQPGV
jgi:hypothetical protein